MNIILMAMLHNEDEGDREFIISLYRHYYPVMKQRAYFVVKDYGVVDDLIHETFIKLIPKISLLRSLSCYKATSYIVNSLRNVCIDYVRKEKRHAHYVFSGLTDDVADHLFDAQAATEEIFLQREDMENLEKAMLQLNERDRNLLYFKYNMGLNDKEIGELLNIPAGHVRQYALRARQRLLRLLSEGSKGREE